MKDDNQKLSRLNDRFSAFAFGTKPSKPASMYEVIHAITDAVKRGVAEQGKGATFSPSELVHYGCPYSVMRIGRSAKARPEALQLAGVSYVEGRFRLL